MDLATFQLSDVFLCQAGDRFRPATVTAWPPIPPSEGEAAMFGGFPGIYRNQKDDGSVDFSFAWFAGKVQSSSRNNIGIVLDIARSIATSPLPRIPPNADLGGWSGGPVFRVIEEGSIERLELAAIIYEYSPVNEITLAHPLSDLAEDGTFNCQ
jgi:hypothetical protein